MRALRRHLVACTVVWALGQLAWLSAFVPRDCCAAHGAHAVDRAHEACRRAMAAAHAGHGSAHPQGADAAAGHRHAADQAHGNHVHQSGHAEAYTNDAPPPPDPCVMRGMCDGPLSALASLMSNQGVPQRVATIDPDLQVTSPSLRIVQRTVRISITPETPPPRA